MTAENDEEGKDERWSYRSHKFSKEGDGAPAPSDDGKTRSEVTSAGSKRSRTTQTGGNVATAGWLLRKSYHVKGKRKDP